MCFVLVHHILEYVDFYVYFKDIKVEKETFPHHILYFDHMGFSLSVLS